MESTLKEINAVLGVVGSFVCTPDGTVAGRALPNSIDEEKIQFIARVASQTFKALETSGQRTQELDMVYDRHRLILKSLRGGVLGILCVRTVNLPLVNLTVNVAVKAITAELKGAKTAPLAAPTPAPAAAPMPVPAAAPTPPPPAVHAPEPPRAAVMPPAPTLASSPSPQKRAAEDVPPLVAELGLEIHRILNAATRARLDLRVMDAMAIWLATTHAHTLLVPPEKREIILAGRAAQADALVSLLTQLGYKPNQRFNAFYGNRRLKFTRTDCDQVVDVFLDTFSMYHRLDLAPYLSGENIVMPETVLLLTRLQMVEMNDAGLRDLCALLSEHDLSVGPERGKVDASLITRLCAEDWGWYKTACMNLDRLTSFAGSAVSGSDRSVILERVERLRQSIERAPKGLRWQTRARLGESVRWYDTPVIGNPSGRPDMAMG